MKKHYIIIGIVLVSVIFFIPAVIKKYNSSKVGTDIENDPSTLNARIEKIGQNPWEQTKYDSLMSEISGLASDEQISTSAADSYRGTLNINMQNALAISYKKSLTESCYATDITILNRASDTISNPIPELNRQKSIYKSYKRALGFKTTLNILLAKKYSESESIKLKNAFQSSYSGEPFRNCTSIRNLKNEIDQKVSSLRDFDADYKIKIIDKEFPETFFYTSNESRMTQLKRYDYYYQDFLTRQ